MSESSKNTVIKTIKSLGFPWETRDPFLFCAHHLDRYPPGNKDMGPPEEHLKGRPLGNDFTVKDAFRMYHGERVPGFPAHPHRGFETVTLARQGFVDHADSLGGSGRFGTGDVQWMTAGRGLQHSEMFPLIDREQENTLEIFQVWLNLPRASKMVDPYYSMLWQKDIPIVSQTDEQGRRADIRLIAGELDGRVGPSPNPDSWAADPGNDVAIWTIELEAYAHWELPAGDPGSTRVLYLHKGGPIELGGQSVPNEHMIDLEADKPVSIKNGGEQSELLMLQGKPIDEPVAQQGPFVMNYPAELRQAMMDFQDTGFGGWPWRRPDPVYQAGRGRFADGGNA